MMVRLVQEGNHSNGKRPSARLSTEQMILYSWHLNHCATAVPSCVKYYCFCIRIYRAGQRLNCFKLPFNLFAEMPVADSIVGIT